MKGTGKAIGIILLVAFFLVVLFAATVGIGALVNGVTFYDQIRLWFGSGSSFAKLFMQ